MVIRSNSTKWAEGWIQYRICVFVCRVIPVVIALVLRIANLKKGKVTPG